jgi:hypothetical protein
MPGHRINCYYCKSSVLSRDIGRHILKNHPDQHFTGQNLKDLHKDKYLTTPLQQWIDNTIVYFCLADDSCIRNSPTAEIHFKGKKDKHRERLLALRETFPLTSQTETSSPSVPLLSEKDKTRVQEEIIELLSHIWSLEQQFITDNRCTFTQNKRVIDIFRKLGFIYDLEELKELHPSSFPGADTEEEEEEPSEHEHYEEPPPPLEEQEQTTVEVLDNRKIDRPPPPPPYTTPTLPKPTPDIFLPQGTRQSSFPSLKIIQTTKRPPTQ